MADFSLQIRNWYRLNSRELPWRKTKDPYKIWLSEIILQQTKVDQGLAYYDRFISSFPDLRMLAEANEQDILNLWQGLGYYSRARNLHFAANQIVNDFNGVFPDNYNDILKLKGVGEYTAAAISSFAFGEARGVVDGNVYRVLSRVFDIDDPIDLSRGQKRFSALANELISKTSPAEHNQAIMELGAMICKPSRPKCEACPVNNMCLAIANKTINERPVKSKKLKIQDLFFHFIVVSDDNGLILEKRHDGIWKNMFQFPLLETKSMELPSQLKKIYIEQEYRTKHNLSHRRIHATFYKMSALPKLFERRELIKIPHGELEKYPLPRLIDRYLEDVDL